MKLSVELNSLVINDLVYEAKAKSFFLKAKDMKNFQGQGKAI